MVSFDSLFMSKNIFRSKCVAHRFFFPPPLSCPLTYRLHCLFHSSQLLQNKIPISVYFQQISLCLSSSSSTSLALGPFFLVSLSSLAAWHFTTFSRDSYAKWSYWESATVNSRRPDVMCLKHRWTAQVSDSWRKRLKGKKGENQRQKEMRRRRWWPDR